MRAICQADGKTWSITGGAGVGRGFLLQAALFIRTRDYVMFIYAFAFVFHLCFFFFTSTAHDSLGCHASAAGKEILKSSFHICIKTISFARILPSSSCFDFVTL